MFTATVLISRGLKPSCMPSKHCVATSSQSIPERMSQCLSPCKQCCGKWRVVRGGVMRGGTPNKERRGLGVTAGSKPSSCCTSRNVSSFGWDCTHYNLAPRERTVRLLEASSFVVSNACMQAVALESDLREYLAMTCRTSSQWPRVSELPLDSEALFPQGWNTGVSLR